MDNNKINICISFIYKKKPYKLCFYTSSIYNKPSRKELSENDLYARNELLVRGDIQPLLSTITNRNELLLLRNLEVTYDGQIVYKASEYEVWHIPPMNK